MVNYNEWIRDARVQLSEYTQDIQSVEWLVMDILGWNRMDLILNQNQFIPKEILCCLDEGLMALKNHVPVQYIVGKATFWGKSFKVNEHVLIPRPETEEVVERFLNLIPSNGKIADIGTGTGVIAITVKNERPQLKVYASDISNEALKTARDNATTHQSNIHFLLGDGLKPFINQNIYLDGLISNPPYIGYDELKAMDQSVIQYEPHVALFADQGGYALYEQLFQDIPKVLNDGAPVVMEIGYQQGKQLKEKLLTYYPHLFPEVHHDINGNERILSFIWTHE